MSTELKPVQLVVIAALASGKSVARAARESGVSARTVFRWLKEDAFHSELRTQTQLLREMSSARAMAAGVKGMRELQRQMSSRDPAQQLRAAKAAFSGLVSLVRNGSDTAETRVPPLFALPNGSTVSLDVEPAPLPNERRSEHPGLPAVRAAPSVLNYDDD
jgi:transposase-like protein